ncbi:hypothetical protein [Micromonospora sp. WMMD1155]|uniref:hypothetical protein n=1 Tax=Micromonospora sp. WMMD1155 TaxID=3016094 RepID=UPI00249C66B1|nr:hypothetical protein [Micromonospora sp. WMMD1155]WFE49981.1 hypothetical protein O7617_06455 [Micromonospora sp. WMMD1155]
MTFNRSTRTRRGTAVVAMIAVTAASVLFGEPASADPAPVPIPPAALTDRAFGQVAETHIQGADRIKAVVLSAEFVQWHRLHPNATTEQAQAQLTARKQVLDSSLTGYDLLVPEQDLLLRSVDILLGTPGGDTRTAPEITGLVAAVIGKTVEPWDTREELASGALRTAQWLRGRDDALAAVWSAVRQAATADAPVASAWNAVLGAPFGVDVTRTYEQLTQDPGLSHVNLGAILALQGDPVAYVAAAKQKLASLHARLLGLSVEIRLEIGANNSKCPPEGPPSAECTAAAKKAAEDRDKARQQTISDVKAGLGMVSTLIGFADPDAGKKAKVIGEAVLTTISAISKYAAAITGRGLAGSVFNTATLAMTGNIFGAVMSIVGLFGNSAPSLDAQILAQVKALRDEVRALGDEMRAGFARVEAQINTVYANMMAQFDKLNAAIAGNTAQLTLVQQQVAQLGLRLEDIAATVLAAIGDATLHDARADINKYIGYLENFGQPIPTYGEFVGPENEFHLTATQLAGGAAFVVPKADADNPALDPTTVLNSFGEARSINYLARVARGRDPSMVEPATPVGNPTVWNLGAQAYSMLMLQNPTYAAQVSASRAAQIEAEGTRIADLTASFGRPVDGNANSLITGLVDEYLGATNELSTALRAFRTNEIQVRWEPDANGVQVKTPKDYDLFWDTDKQLAPAPAKADEATVPSCNGTRQIDRPGNVRYDLMSNVVRTLHYAYTPRPDEPPAGVRELPEVGHCYTPSWVHTRTTGYGTGVIRYYGKLRLQIHSRFRLNSSSAWQTSRTADFTWPDEQVYQVDCELFNCDSETSPDQALTQKWPSGRYTFASVATAVPNPALDASLTPTLRGFLQARQKSMYDRVRDLSNQTSGPVPTALKKMNTAARLLQAYTRLGLPNALDADDVLSANLFGQYQIPVNMPTDAKIGNAYAKAGGNYAACGPAPCAPDPSRPLRDQVSLKLPCEPAVDSSNLPGDPLGDCLVTSARSRASALTQRYEVWADQMTAGLHRERVPWLNDTLTGLRITTRLTHAD